MGIRVIRYPRELMALLTKATIEAHSDVPSDAECVGVITDGAGIVIVMQSKEWGGEGEFVPTWREGKKAVSLPNDYHSPPENSRYRNIAMSDTVGNEASCSGVPEPPADSVDKTAPSNIVEFKNPSRKSHD